MRNWKTWIKQLGGVSRLQPHFFGSLQTPVGIASLDTEAWRLKGSKGYAFDRVALKSGGCAQRSDLFKVGCCVAEVMLGGGSRFQSNQLVSLLTAVFTFRSGYARLEIRQTLKSSTLIVEALQPGGCAQPGSKHFPEAPVQK